MFFTKKYDSKINGQMILTKHFDGWNLKIPSGLQYSGSYLEKMWENVFEKFEDESPSNVLILGSGAGSSAFEVKKRWPTAKVDAVDYDPEIIKVGKEIYNFADQQIVFFVSDANDFVNTCDKKYDLVIIDLFVRSEASPLLKNQIFIEKLSKCLSPLANIIINSSVSLKNQDTQIISTLKINFPTLGEYVFLGNLLLVTEKRNIPSDYENLFQSELYSRVLKRNGYKVIGVPGSKILVRSFCGICLAVYAYGDTEPSIKFIKKQGYNHGVIFWLPWRLRYVPSDWFRDFSSVRPRGNGFSEVSDKYEDKWSQTARRDLNSFIKNDIKIKYGDKDDFLASAKKSTSSPIIKSILVDSIKQMEAENVLYLMAVDNNDVLGGLAIVNYDNTSYNITSFVTKKGMKLNVSTGLINEWYKITKEKKIKYLNFGYIRQKNEAESWQGFSNFKRKFIDKEIKLQKGYFKFF